MPDIRSTVRTNLLTRKGYTPYCGSPTCIHRGPRTKFNGTQFECECGWKSNFPASFITKYKQFISNGKSIPSV